MPKRNYGYEKRQKELGRQRKREEKLKRKLDRARDRAGNPIVPDEEKAGLPRPEDAR